MVITFGYALRQRVQVSSDAITSHAVKDEMRAQRLGKDGHRIDKDHLLRPSVQNARQKGSFLKNAMIG
jgi:hypothetical protein